MDLSFTIAGKKIEAAWHGPAPEKAPTLVLLHEGLGSVAMWKEFPQKLAERTGYGVLVYSRLGYGQSDPVELPRPLSYMHDEARDILPGVLDQAGVRKTILIGHSDGASIATISAGLTLMPGDIIATGTPAGVGIGFDPPRYLKGGDVVRIEIDGIGALENPFEEVPA